jgi:selenocysteine lyase/cysteine desulfurase
MEKYFERFRNNTIGHDQEYLSPYGKQRIVYADWVASGRLYKPIEDRVAKVVGPYVANTHTEASETGTLMTKAYQMAQKKIKQHCNAGKDDVIISAGFQRILGLKVNMKMNTGSFKSVDDKPVVFITHMEHHSNQTSWYETVADVVVVEPGKDLQCDLNNLEAALEKYKSRKVKYGSFSACSNVTGIEPPYHEMAKLMHKYGGYCFIDFAASAPYVKIDMHPEDKDAKLDAIFFSPHKFLGGPGTSGVMIFDKALYTNYTPDQPGGGTVEWTNPWGEYKYIEDIEIREDGGTPGFLQAIRTALCIELKNEMGIKNILKREEELLKIAFSELRKIPHLHILADNIEHRLGIVSFYIDNIHYNLIVRMMSDRYGVQVRGGCACAGTYGHYLLDVDHKHSRKITELINQGDLSLKPGWVRLSLHQTMTNEELHLVCRALKEIQINFDIWKNDYVYNNYTNEFSFKGGNKEEVDVSEWFAL